jgi:hypothetical protein
MDRIFTVLGWFVLATLALAIARQLSEQKLIDESLYAPAALLERFVDLNPASLKEPAGSLNPRDAYALLSGVIPVKKESKTGDLTAQSCYGTDFLAQTQMTGNYSQTTNNFKHRAPDSCSAPITAFVNTIYNQ